MKQSLRDAVREFRLAKTLKVIELGGEIPKEGRPPRSRRAKRFGGDAWRKPPAGPALDPLQAQLELEKESGDQFMVDMIQRQINYFNEVRG